MRRISTDPNEQKKDKRAHQFLLVVFSPEPFYSMHIPNYRYCHSYETTKKFKIESAYIKRVGEYSGAFYVLRSPVSMPLS